MTCYFYSRHCPTAWHFTARFKKCCDILTECRGILKVSENIYDVGRVNVKTEWTGRLDVKVNFKTEWTGRLDVKVNF